MAADVNATLVEQIANMQRQLTETVKTSIIQVEERLHSQLTEHMDKHHKQLTERMDTQADRINQLEAKFETSQTAWSQPAKASSWNMDVDGEPARSPPAARKRRLTFAGPRAEHSNTVEGEALWVGGFPHEVVRSAFEKVFSELMSKLPTADQEQCRLVGRGFVKSFRVACNNDSVANKLLDSCFAMPCYYESSSGRFELRVRRARTPAERTITRSLGAL